MSNFILCQADGWVLVTYRGKLQRHCFPHTQIVDVVIIVVVVVDLIDVKADVVITLLL